MTYVSHNASGGPKARREEVCEKGEARPLAEYVRFETENGLVLLYEPGPLDRWIGTPSNMMDRSLLKPDS